MKGTMDKERKERIEKMIDAPPGTEVGVHLAVQADPLGLGAVRLDIGVWAHPLVTPPLKQPQPGDKVMTILNVVQDKMYWIGFIDAQGFNW